MENSFTPPDIEQPQNKIELSVTKPPGKNFMIRFDSSDSTTCFVYNIAIRSVLSEAGLDPFHQIGGESDKPGYHGWEIWKSSTEADMNALLPKIEEKAKRMLEN